MRRAASIAILAGLWAFGCGAVAAEPRPSSVVATTSGAALSVTDLSAQSRRVRPSLRIVPRYPYRRFNSVYPLPYDVEYPGPNAVRQCVDWYATEHRPSGTVIVPRMRCRWITG